MYSQSFQSSEKSRIVNLAESVLNLNKVSSEPQNLKDLFKIYENILNKDVSKDFEKSMKNSRELIFYTKFEPSKLTFGDVTDYSKVRDKLKDLESDNKDSLLIVPIGTSGHMISGVIKKTGDEFSLTIVNKGYRDTKLYRPLEQFIVSKNKMNEAINNLNHLGKKDVSKVYEMLQQIGKRGIVEKQPKTEQKAENCFIKEVENAIQFALETSSGSNGEKWNGKSTLEVHEKFIKELQKQYPEHRDEIKKVYHTYEINKSLSKILPNIEQVIKEAAKNNDRQLISRITNNIGSISEATLMKNIKPAMNYLQLIGDKNSYNNLNLMYKIKKMVSKGEIDLNSEKINFINQKLSEAGEKFPQLSKEIKMYVCEKVVDFNGPLQDLTNKIIENIQNNKPNRVEKSIDEMSKIYKDGLKLDPHNLTFSKKYAMMMNIVKSSIDKVDIKKSPELEISKNKIYKEYDNALLTTMIISPSTADINKIKEIDIPLSQKSELKKDIKKFSGEITESKREKDVVSKTIKSREISRNMDL